MGVLGSDQDSYSNISSLNDREKSFNALLSRVLALIDSICIFSYLHPWVFFFRFDLHICVLALTNHLRNRKMYLFATLLLLFAPIPRTTSNDTLSVAQKKNLAKQTILLFPGTFRWMARGRVKIQIQIKYKWKASAVFLL